MNAKHLVLAQLWLYLPSAHVFSRLEIINHPSINLFLASRMASVRKKSYASESSERRSNFLGTLNFSKRLRMLSRLKITWNRGSMWRISVSNGGFQFQSGSCHLLQIDLWSVMTSIHKKGLWYFPSVIFPGVQDWLMNEGLNNIILVQKVHLKFLELHSEPSSTPNST